MPKLPFDNGGLKFILGLFFSALLIPLLATAFGYGRLSNSVENVISTVERHYATKLELEKINTTIQGVKIILEHSPWYDAEVHADIAKLQRESNERIRRLGHYSPEEETTPPR